MLCYAMLCYAMLCYAMLCYAMLCYAMLCYAMLCYAMLCYAMLCYAMLCYAMLCYAMLCYAMLCYAMLCYAMLCYAMLCYAMLCYAMLFLSTGGYAQSYYVIIALLSDAVKVTCPLDIMKCPLDIPKCLFVHRTNRNVHWTFQMSIRPFDKQKCPLEIQMSIRPMDEQKCPVDIQMSIGHIAVVLDMYAFLVLRGSNTKKNLVCFNAMQFVFGQVLRHGTTNIKISFSKLPLPWLPCQILPDIEKSIYL